MSEDIYSLLAKYFSGQATAEEADTVKKWSSASPENKMILEEAEKIWQLTGEQPAAEFDTEGAWQKVKQAIEPAADRSNGLFRRMYFRVAAAAAVLLLLVAGFWWLRQSGNSVKTLTAVNDVQEIILEDGSHVFLRRGATVTYPAHFSKAQRKLELSGEAFFEIARKPEQPFVISAAGTEVKVLGTSFLVNAGTTAVSVSVKTGKVQFTFLKDTSLRAVLEPGDGAMIAGGKLIRQLIADENIDSWKTGVLVFRNTPVKQVMETLGRHYGVQFSIKEGNEAAVEATMITTEFKNQPLDTVLQELELITAFKIQKVSGRAFEISTK